MSVKEIKETDVHSQICERCDYPLDSLEVVHANDSPEDGMCLGVAMFAGYHFDREGFYRRLQDVRDGKGKL